MKKVPLHVKILIALVLAFSIGLWSNHSTEDTVEKPDWFIFIRDISTFIGTLFLNALKMVVIPLVMTSIICGVAKIGGEKDFGRLGLKTLLFYSLTGCSRSLPVCFASILSNLGKSRKRSVRKCSTINPTGIHPRSRVHWSKPTGVGRHPRNLSPHGTRKPFQGSGGRTTARTDRLQPALRVFITKLPEKHQAIQLGFWESLNSLILSITNFIISFAPYGVFGLVTPTLMKVGLETLSVMGSFALTVALGLLIHSLVVLPLLLRLFGKINFIDHYRAMAPALLTAFSTASSSATLPLTMECVTKRAGVSKKVSSFTLPLGATMNMDGTALFECVVVVFLAQLFGVEMGMITQATVVLMALLTSIGVAGIPSASWLRSSSSFKP